MYIVVLKNYKPNGGDSDHSAWDTEGDAMQQKKVLEKRGYSDVAIKEKYFIQCENGTYFV